MASNPRAAVGLAALLILLAFLFVPRTDAPTVTYIPSPTESATNTDAPTATFTDTETTTPTETPLPTSTNTPSATQTATDTQTPTPTQTNTPTPVLDDPTPTSETFVTTQAQLYACLAQVGVRTCAITARIEISAKTPPLAPYLTLRCTPNGSLTNAPQYIGRVLEIISTAHIVIEDCTMDRTVNAELSCCADTFFVLNSDDVLCRNCSILYGVDESVDVQFSTNVAFIDSIIGLPLNNSTHQKGAHGYAMLITNSDVTISGSVITSAKARMPQCQFSICTIVGSIIQNYDGSGVAAVGDTRLTFRGNICRGGVDTDAISYCIVTPNRSDYTVWPTIDERGNLLLNAYRIRRPADRDSYLAVPSEAAPNASAYETIVRNSGAASELTQRVRECLLDNSCQIIDVPLG